jgi:hypothetical protein
MDDEKPKHKNGYRQNRELAMMCVLWGILVFFRLDELVGAWGLRQYYWWGSLVVQIVLLSITFVLMCLWQFDSKIIVVAGFMVGLSVLSLLVDGWLCLIPMAMFSTFTFGLSKLPSSIFLIGFVISLGVWGWGLLKPHFYRTDYVKAIILIVVFFTVAYTFIVSAPYENDIFVDDTQFANHYYHLGAYTDFGDPEGVYLSECNEYRVYCREVYRSVVQLLYRRTARLVMNDELGTVDLMIDDELLYRHTPS